MTNMRRLQHLTMSRINPGYYYNICGEELIYIGFFAIDGNYYHKFFNTTINDEEKFNYRNLELINDTNGIYLKYNTSYDFDNKESLTTDLDNLETGLVYTLHYPEKYFNPSDLLLIKKEDSTYYFVDEYSLDATGTVLSNDKKIIKIQEEDINTKCVLIKKEDSVPYEINEEVVINFSYRKKEKKMIEVYV